MAITNNLFVSGTTATEAATDITNHEKANYVAGNFIYANKLMTDLRNSSLITYSLINVLNTNVTGSDTGTLQHNTSINDASAMVEHLLNNYIRNKKASTSDVGGIKLGYNASGKNYAINVDNDKAFVTVPGRVIKVNGTEQISDSSITALDLLNGTNVTLTPGTGANLGKVTIDCTIPEASSNVLGGIKLGYASSGKEYGLTLDENKKAYVTVPGRIIKANGVTQIADTSSDAVDFVNGTNTTVSVETQGTTKKIKVNVTSEAVTADVAVGNGLNNIVENNLHKIIVKNGLGLSFESDGSLIPTLGFTTSAGDRNFAILKNSDGKLYTNISLGGSTPGLVKSSSTGTIQGRDYNVAINNDGTMKVNVPWTDTTYSAVTTSAPGLCPQLLIEVGGKFLRADGTWAVPQDTTYEAEKGISLFNGKFGHSNTAITAQATSGIYPIKIDAYGHITEYGDKLTTFGGSGVNHSSGLVPDPGATAGTTRYLREDGSWQVPPDIQYTLPAATANALGGIKIGYTENDKNYAVKLDSEKAYVTVPWENTTYESKAAAQSGTEVSLVTTGEKYTWNNKQNALNAGSNIVITNNSISVTGLGQQVNYTIDDDVLTITPIV